MIKAVYFDHGGVLVHGGKPGLFRELMADKMGVDAGSIEIGDLLDILKVSTISGDDFITRVNERYPNARSKLDDTIWASMKPVFNRSKEVYGVAQELRNAGIITGILSNVYPDTAKLLHRKGLYIDFSPLLLSCDERLAKPNPLFYELAQQRLKSVKHQEILFIDDQQHCLDAATSFGWKTIKAVNGAQIARDVRALIQKENGIISL